MRPSFNFSELDKTIHKRASFASGTQELDAFLKQFAVRHREAGISKTMVMTASDNDTDICAYYTLSHTEAARQTLPQALAKKLPHYPVPVMLIAQLAVHQTLQKQGLGKVSLIAALRHAYDINIHLPSYAVVVDAPDENVQGFYKRYGFQPLDTYNHRSRLFLSMKTVAQLFTGDV